MTDHICPTCGTPRPDLAPLTPLQASVYRFMTTRYAETGVTPTLQELCDEFGWSSLASPYEIVGRLIKKGWVKRLERRRERCYMPVGGRLDA